MSYPETVTCCETLRSSASWCLSKSLTTQLSCKTVVKIKLECLHRCMHVVNENNISVQLTDFSPSPRIKDLIETHTVILPNLST